MIVSKQDIDDEFVWAKCLEGNLTYIEILYKRFYEELIEYGTKIIGDKDTALDYVQMLFVNIMSNYKKLSHTDKVKAYLLRSYRNLFIDDYRVRKKYIPFDMADIEDLDFRYAEVKKYNVEVLNLAFSELSVREKEVIYLFYFRDLSHDEIAVIFNMNIQSSRNLLCKSMNHFREIFYRYYK